MGVFINLNNTYIYHLSFQLPPCRRMCHALWEVSACWYHFFMWPDYDASWLSNDWQDKTSDAFDVWFIIQLAVEITGRIHKESYLTIYNLIFRKPLREILLNNSCVSWMNIKSWISSHNVIKIKINQMKRKVWLITYMKTIIQINKSNKLLAKPLGLNHLLRNVM